MDLFGAQDTPPSYDTKMLVKVVFDKRAFVKFKTKHSRNTFKATKIP